MTVTKPGVALITGVTGQDGAYLADLLLARATSCTASSGARRRSIPSASTTSIAIRTSTTCGSSCTTAT